MGQYRFGSAIGPPGFQRFTPMPFLEVAFSGVPCLATVSFLMGITQAEWFFLAFSNGGKRKRGGSSCLDLRREGLAFLVTPVGLLQL